MNNIIIDLAESRNAHKFSEGNLIHADEFNQVINWIEQRLTYIDNIENLGRGVKQHEPIRLHETITILGTRGSGKTSFLLSILDECRKKDIEVINIIDPTLIEEKGHIFLTILSEINHKVTTALANKECSPEKDDYFSKKNWDKLLQNMAKGLPAMDIINNGYQDWCDPEYVMNTGLHNVYAARTLEENFHKLLKLGLKILNKKAFIIALDDVDIDFRKGWPLLETIRKYMTTPYMITLLSGDMRLFSKAIRKQQWKNFGKALLKNEGEYLSQINEYNDFVTEMENQYMLKVLQPVRRVHLTTLKEKVDLKNGNINIFVNNTAASNRIDTFYYTVFSLFGVTNLYQAEAYRSVMLSQPLRRQIHFLAIFDDIGKYPIDTHSMVDEIADVFLSDLYVKNIDIDQIKTNDAFLVPIILRLLINEKALDETYQLQPITTDQNLNITLIVLSLIFSLKVQNNPYLIFDYFLRIGYIRNILSALGYQTNDKNTLSPSIEHMCQFVNIYNDTGLRDIACSMSAYMQASIKNNKDGEDFFGIINLPGLELNQKQRKQEIAWRIDDVFKDAPKLLKDIAFLPLSISQDNKSNQGHLSYSIYTLLAAIGEIIRKFKTNDKEWATLVQLRAYPMPAFDRGNASGKIDIKTYEQEKGKDDYRISLVFKRWIDSFPKNYSISPHLLGRISTRFFYAIRTIEGKSEQANLAESMQTRVLLFMNSVLIEEVKENAPDMIHKLNINNPNLSDFIFRTNLQTINKGLNRDFESLKNKLKLSKWICSCPLLLIFLNLNNKDNLLLESLKKFTNIVGNMQRYSIFDRLSNVTFSDPNPKSDTAQVNADKPRFNSCKLSERAKVISLLKKYNVPRDLFDIKKNQPETVEANDKIRTLTKGLFTEEKLESHYIRQFRSYIAEQGIVW